MGFSSRVRGLLTAILIICPLLADQPIGAELASEPPQADKVEPAVLASYRNQFQDFEVVGFISHVATATSDTPAIHYVWHVRYRQQGSLYFIEELEIARDKKELSPPRYEWEHRLDGLVVKMSSGGANPQMLFRKPDDRRFASLDVTRQRIMMGLGTSWTEAFPEKVPWESVTELRPGVFRATRRRQAEPSTQYAGEEISVTYTRDGTPLQIVSGDPAAPRFIVRWENPEPAQGFPIPIPRFAHFVYWMDKIGRVADMKFVIRSIRPLSPGETLGPPAIPIGTEVMDRVKDTTYYEGGEMGADRARLFEDPPSREAMLNAPLKYAPR